MKVNYNGHRVDFEPLLQVLQVKDALLLAVEPLRKNMKINSGTTAAVMFNILGFYLQLLEDSEQIGFIEDVQKELKSMIENGLDKFDRGQKIK